MAVIICVLLVFVCDRIEKKHALTGDYSFNAATVQGEVSREVLDALEKDVHIYAVVPQQGENATLMKLPGPRPGACAWRQEEPQRPGAAKKCIDENESNSSKDGFYSRTKQEAVKDL